ncbi:MAG: nodulation protein NfeD [Actinomycetota bacterium]|nr:nodulation protein NfeD [Actinomycetota bacterium]
MSRPGVPRIVRIGAGLAILVACLASGVASAQQPGATVDRVMLDGVVDPFIANHIQTSIDDAATRGDAAVLIVIDTPGGLESSMREISQAILNARIPVICYVSPLGARAASAGAFVLLSCPVAAMAPGTNVGASTPVGLSGAVGSQKEVNDAAASIRSLAERSHRNADVAESFVRQAASITAEQALHEDVIDLISPSEGQLLADVSGRTVTLADGRTVTLATAGATIVDRNMGLVAGFLHGLFDPNLAFIFFWLGLALIVVELIFPGHIVSGTLGVVLFVVAVVSFGLLPVRLIGIALLALSVLFFLFEARHPGFGVWGVLGLIGLVLGGLSLFNGTGGVHVSPLVIAPVALAAAGFFGYAATKAIAIRRMPPPAGNERIVGAEGVVLGIGLNPEGVVRVASEEWKATSAAGPVAAGTRVRVVRIDGLVVTVESLGGEHAPSAPTGGATAGEGGNQG